MCLAIPNRVLWKEMSCSSKLKARRSPQREFEYHITVLAIWKSISTTYGKSEALIEIGREEKSEGVAAAPTFDQL